MSLRSSSVPPAKNWAVPRVLALICESLDLTVFNFLYFLIGNLFKMFFFRHKIKQASVHKLI